MNPIKLHFSRLAMLLLLVCLIPNPGKAQEPSTSTKVPDTPFDRKFMKMFARDCCGVTGADGEYSVLLPDGAQSGSSAIPSSEPSIPTVQEKNANHGSSATAWPCRKPIPCGRYTR